MTEKDKKDHNIGFNLAIMGSISVLVAGALIFFGASSDKDLKTNDKYYCLGLIILVINVVLFGIWALYIENKESQKKN